MSDSDVSLLLFSIATNEMIDSSLILIHDEPKKEGLVSHP